MSERKTIGHNPDQKHCGICGKHRALTGSGQLHTMAVRGPRATYVRRICADCVELFNARGWAQVRRTLRQVLMERGKHLWPVRNT